MYWKSDISWGILIHLTLAMNIYWNFSFVEFLSVSVNTAQLLVSCCTVHCPKGNRSSAIRTRNVVGNTRYYSIEYMRNISWSISFSSTFHVISQKFWLLFGQCRNVCVLYRLWVRMIPSELCMMCAIVSLSDRISARFWKIILKLR